MMPSLEIAPLDATRSVIASVVLGPETIDARLGEIELRPHQQRAAARLATMIASHGGAMLAEPVGVGKTYTALAVAALGGAGVLVVAPAALRDMWREAALRCGVSIEIATHEGLSRGRAPAKAPRFVIVDEAHRLRSAATRRYALLADLCRRSEVLLVTATPVQNAASDLAAQLALFLGRAAWNMSEEQLTAFIVRDSESRLAVRPRLDGPHRVMLDVEDDCLDLLVALPSPVPAKGESLAAALLTYGLVHQWTSSRAALTASLARRRSRGLALLSALEAGRHPTRAELSAWTHAGDALQLAFPEIVASNATTSDVDSDALLLAIDRHGAMIDALLRIVRDTPDPDRARADALRDIRRAHPGARIIAFSQYAETVAALGARLSRDPGIATLTASGARVAGGRIRREDAIAQFTPAEGRIEHRAERIDLLVTTDLLSEGLNLQEASVIVHLDLPWNPARLDQRVGRALRLGSRHPVVTVYAIAPPASAERLLRLETRLREKLAVAQRTVGVAGSILPSPLGGMLTGQSLAEQRSTFENVLRTWSSSSHTRIERDATIVAAVAANRAGFLALIRSPRGRLLVADTGDGIATTTSVVSRAIDACSGAECSVDIPCALAARESLDRWLDARRGADTVNLNVASTARARRAALTRVAQAIARAPRHRRSQLAPLAAAARSIASAQLGEGAERVLEMLVRAELPDEAWLRSLAAFGELNARPSPADPPRDASEVSDKVIALILLQASADRPGAPLASVDGRPSETIGV